MSKDIDGERVHYKFPAVALSSITNRVTGCVLSGGVAFGGVLSFVGGPETLPAFVEGFNSWLPFMVYPTKLAFGFPFVYHTLGGFRHLYWDKTTEGIDNQSAKASSIALFAASGVILPQMVPHIQSRRRNAPHAKSASQFCRPPDERGLSRFDDWQYRFHQITLPHLEKHRLHGWARCHLSPSMQRHLARVRRKILQRGSNLLSLLN